MAKQVKLSASHRTSYGRHPMKRLRSTGYIPANIYGITGAASLQINEREIKSLLAHSIGENILIELSIDEHLSKLSLIQEIQYHPVTRNMLHIDFLEIDVNKPFVTDVFIEAVGEPIGVKNSGGLLEHSLRSLSIECLPKDLPNVIQMDITRLDIGQSLHVSDIMLPEGVVSITAGDITVFSVFSSRLDTAGISKSVDNSQEPEVIREVKPIEAVSTSKK